MKKLGLVFAGLAVCGVLGSGHWSRAEITVKISPSHSSGADPSSDAPAAASESQTAAAGGAVRTPSVEEFFNGLNKDTMDLVDAFYAENTHFLDPVVDLKGRAAVRKYYENLYQNVTSIRFEFHGMVTEGEHQVAFWTMILQAKRLNGGKEVRVEGNSHFRFDPTTRQAIYHRDYFDMGEFIYEDLPILGRVIRMIKARLAPKLD